MGTQPQPAREQGRPLETFLPQIEGLLRKVIEHGGFNLAFSIHKPSPAEEGLETPEYAVDFSGQDSDILLERGAALLNALEYVVLRAARLDEKLFGRISFDCQDWRRLHTRELQLTAQIAAERVFETGQPFALNPMSPRERRIVHLALKNQQQVRTVSEGTGPERRVVVLPTSPPARKS